MPTDATFVLTTQRAGGTSSLFQRVTTKGATNQFSYTGSLFVTPEPGFYTLLILALGLVVTFSRTKIKALF